MPCGYSEKCTTSIEVVEISAVGKDNRTIILASKFVEEPKTSVKKYDRKERKTINVECPQIVTIYNKHMGEVDLSNSTIGIGIV